MQLKEFDILLDIKKSVKNEYIEVVQGDYDTNVLNIQLQNGLNNYDLTNTKTEIVFAKPDGTTVIQDENNGVAVVNATEGRMTCTLNTNTIAAAGKVVAEVRIMDLEGKLLTTARFDFFVRKAIFGDDTIKSTNEWPLLKKLLEASESEELRETEESIRQSNEEERIQNEQTREDNELNRNINEEQRIVKETERGVAESTRINSENERIANEEIRRTNEQNRQSNEVTRIENENIRISQEESRVLAEESRESNETIRQQNENERESNEADRISSELARESNEDTRIANENARVQAEDVRATTFAGYEERVSTVEDDLVAHKAEQKLKVAKLEQELNNYKAVMSQMNINQEATQKASGYGIISLPQNAANGQISGIEVNGQTATNLVENGDFKDGTNKWSVSAYTNFLVEDNIGIKQTQAEQIFGFIYNNIGKLSINDKIFLRALVKGDENTKNMGIYLRGGFNGGGLSDLIPTGDWQLAYKIVEITSEPTDDVHVAFRSESIDSSIESVTYIKEFFALNLTQLGLEDKTADEINEMFPYYFEGTKSTVSAIRLKSVGKNLFDNLKLEVGGMSHDTGKPLPDTTRSRLKDFLNIRPNTSYILSAKDRVISSDITRIYFYNRDKAYIGSSSSKSFITPIDARYFKFLNQSTNDINIKYQLEEGTVATPYEPYKESVAYITAKDEEGNIIELNSLPNGVVDRIYQGTDGKWYLEKNIEEYILQESDIDRLNTNFSNVDIVYIKKPKNSIDYGSVGNFGWTNWIGFNHKNITITDLEENIGYYTDSKPGAPNDIVYYTEKGYYNNLEEAKADLAGTQLIYQLAEPIVTPINVSGNLISYPSGTVYIEPFVADAGIYTDKMEVLYSDLPIKALEKISKVDFDTGLETELDITAAVIAEDKLSFTHPDLVDGDIVFFTYEYDRESTEGETEIEYYDSRYVIKDSVTEKFYKWKIAVANGTPTIELEEV